MPSLQDLADQAANLPGCPAWGELQANAKHVSKLALSDLLDAPGRYANFSRQLGDLVLDFSRNLMTAETFELLLQLADERQLDAAAASGAPVVELHTGAYVDASGEQQSAELKRVVDATAYGHNLGLVINAGHGLHYENVVPVAAIAQIIELNIGHAIVARAVFSGFSNAVRDMKRLMIDARAK